MKKTVLQKKQKTAKKRRVPRKATSVRTKKQEERRVRVRVLDRALKKLFPGAGIALRYGTTWELMVAVMLSAQCTDKKVNEVTEKLFKKYRGIHAYLTADPETFALDIKSTGFYRNKAKNVLAAAQKITDEFDGKIPNTMEELVTIPGVARKTANVVLGNAYGVVEGIAVDTHVRRFVVRYDLSDSLDPVVIEQDLMQLLPKKDWFGFTYRVIEYGRHVAPARKYDISTDPLIPFYPKAAERFRV